MKDYKTVRESWIELKNAWDDLIKEIAETLKIYILLKWLERKLK